MVKIVVEHNGFVIDYAEYTNEWIVVMRDGNPISGNSKLSANSLAEVKDKIDKLLSSEKKKGFVSQTGYYKTYSGIKQCTTTSFDGDHVWVKDLDGRRSKVNKHGFFPECPKNAESIRKINELNKNAGELEVAAGKLREEAREISNTLVALSQLEVLQ